MRSASATTLAQFLRVLAVLSVAVPAAAIEPLQCPEGTQLKTHDDANSRSEYCADLETSRKRGPQREFDPQGRLRAEGVNEGDGKQASARLYNEQGELTDEIDITNGRISRRRMTLAGMKAFVDSLSRQRSEKAKDPQKATFRVIDERNVGVDFHFPDADPVNGKARLDGFRLYVRARFCPLTTGAEVIDAIQIRVFNDQDAEPAMSTILRREECGGSAQ